MFLAYFVASWPTYCHYIWDTIIALFIISVWTSEISNTQGRDPIATGYWRIAWSTTDIVLRPGQQIAMSTYPGLRDCHAFSDELYETRLGFEQKSVGLQSNVPIRTLGLEWVQGHLELVRDAGSLSPHQTNLHQNLYFKKIPWWGKPEKHQVCNMPLKKALFHPPLFPISCDCKDNHLAYFKQIYVLFPHI